MKQRPGPQLSESSLFRFLRAEQSEEGGLTLTVSVESADDRSVQLQFSCQGVFESLLKPTSQALPISQIQILDDDPLLWDYGPRSSIYGNAPLPDPPRFLFDFIKLFQPKLRGARDPLRYLNWRENFAEWREFVYSRSYLLLTAPQTIAEETALLILDAQAAEYTVLPVEFPPVTPGPKAVLRIGDSWVVCESIEPLAE